MPDTFARVAMSADPAFEPKPLRNQAKKRSETRLAILLMLIAFFFFSIGDLLAKILTKDISPFQVAWFRQMGLVVGIIVLFAFRGFTLLRTPHPILQFMRALCVVVATIAFLAAIPYVPLADATAVGFVAPFIIAILAALILGEAVGLKRWIAISFGFVGTVIIVRPASNAFQPATLLLILSSTAFAMRQVISRFLVGSDSPSTTIAYTVLTAWALLSMTLPFVWHTPDNLLQIGLLIGLACVAGCGEILMVWALKFGEAAILSPLQYTIIIWSTVWGYVVFSDLPDVWTWTGIAIIIASGLYAFKPDASAKT